MKIYNYHPEYKTYVDSSLADESPLEPGVWLIPAHATEFEPPECSSCEIQVFNGSSWEIKENCCGTYYSTITQEKIEHQNPLEPPENATKQQPLEVPEGYDLEWNSDFYFPVPIWWTDTNLDNTKILDVCYQLKDLDPVGRQISNNGGWQSQEVDINQYISNAVNVIKSYFPNIIDQYGFDSDRTKLFFGNSWININKKGDTNNVHLHHGSFLSGIYYVKATSNSGCIKFFRDFNQAFIIKSTAEIINPTYISANVATYSAKTGRLILFPSNLLHSVAASEDDEDRISIAFNIGINYV